MQIENENTLAAALNSGINLFTGSGFSTLSFDQTGRRLPTGAELKTELVSAFSEINLENLDLGQISQVLKARAQDKFLNYLKERMNVFSYDDRYKNINNINIEEFFTTNIDNLPHKIFADLPQYYISDVTIYGRSFKEGLSISFTPLHGSINHIEPDYIFSPMEISSIAADDPDRFFRITSAVQNRPSLFLGYSLRDSGILQALNVTNSTSGQHAPKWILLREKDESSTNYYKSLGFKIITGELEEILDFFGELESPTSEINIETYAFRAQRIPDAGELVPRPLDEFFKGANPIWYDIVNARVPKLSHFDKLVDAIHAGKNLFITGVPVCGKSTLLMQAALEVSSTKSVRIFEHINPDFAAKISSLLPNGHTIFIDDAADSMEAVKILAESKKYQIICFDREHNFELSRHIFPRSLFERYDCSGLSEDDEMELYNSLPASIRRSERANFVGEEEGFVATVFECVERNITSPRLRERFEKSLNELKQKSIEAYDLLLLMSYLHKCRTPTSYDIASRILGSPPINEVYDKLAVLGSMISENVGSFNLIDEDQDFFNPRSNIYSDTIYELSDKTDFCRVFLKFHNSVSSTIIPRSDQFRRYGYDADHAMKAFESVEEGKKFYDRQFRIEQNYYTLQQAAIFMMRKKSFNESFKYIDKSLRLSRNRVPSIRHSHALILFRANITKDTAEKNVRENLDKALEILKTCYNDDRRKTYHVLTYGDCSCKYYDAYGDEIALQHLKTAQTWLEREMREKIPNRGVPAVLSRVRTRL